MDEFDQKLQAMAQQEAFALPVGYSDKIHGICEELKRERRTPHHRLRRWLTSAAAVIALFIALPNTTATVAHAMEQIPILGALVKVVTFREYHYEDGTNHAAVQAPELLSDAKAAGEINEDVKVYVNQILADFQSRLEADGETHQGLDITYSVVTDSESWFTLRLDVLETMASGYQYQVLYHIDKTTGQTVALADLFRPDSDWRTALNGELLGQMNALMESDEGGTYFTEEFTGIPDKQNFYWKESGELVIVFDEYQVAPGSMGCPEFVIPQSVYGPFLK